MFLMRLSSKALFAAKENNITFTESALSQVDKVSQENARLRCFEREHREAQEQLKEAQKQYKLDMDQLGQQVSHAELLRQRPNPDSEKWRQAITRMIFQVNLLYTERNELESSLAKLQAEHDCLMISSQNSVSFHYHSQVSGIDVFGTIGTRPPSPFRSEKKGFFRFRLMANPRQN